MNDNLSPASQDANNTGDIFNEFRIVQATSVLLGHLRKEYWRAETGTCLRKALDGTEIMDQLRIGEINLVTTRAFAQFIVELNTQLAGMIFDDEDDMDDLSDGDFE